MRRHVIALLSSMTALLTVGTSPASGAEEYVTGRCHLIAAHEHSHVVTGDDVFVGLLYGVIVVTDGPSPGNLLQAEVSCVVGVNGEEQDRCSASEVTPGVYVAACVVWFEADENDVVQVCTEVNGRIACDDADQTDVAPEPVNEAISAVVGFAFDELGAVQAIVCPIIGGLTPGLPPLVDVEPEGDVTLLPRSGTPLPVVDCPPYDEFVVSFVWGPLVTVVLDDPVPQID
jgi:hypothetical protein